MLTTVQDGFAMHEFLTYFLSHMPSPEKWVGFLLVNIVAYVAAKNTVLRRERQLEKKAYAQRLEQLKTERREYQQEQEHLVKEQWAIIQRQSHQLDELTNQIKALKQVHLN